MSSRELTDWIAYNKRCPLEPDRGDIQAALIAWQVYNSATGRKKLANLEEFILTFSKNSSKRQSGKERMKALNRWSKQVNAQFQRKELTKNKDGTEKQDG